MSTQDITVEIRTYNITAEVASNAIQVNIENANVDYLHKIIEIPFIIDGGGIPLSIGQKGHLKIPWPCVINQWDIYSDQEGSIVIDIWKDTYANFPPTIADTICGTTKPTLNNAQKAQSNDLTGWTTQINSGDVLAYNVVSVEGITRAILTLKVTRI